jgi:hypothetical protein
MNVDHVFETLNGHGVTYLVIGGVNFLLRHAPVLTFDMAVWIEDTPENLDRCEKALGQLQAEWGTSDEDWGPVANRPRGWLRAQAVFCLNSPYGAIDVFRSVRGLRSWADCRARAAEGQTAAGIPFWGLSDEDMLKCQTALPESEQNRERVRILTESLRRATRG